MKKSVKFLSVASALLTLVACGEKEKPATKAAEPAKTVAKEAVTLRFSWWGGDERHKLTLDAIKAFEDKNPGIKIVPEYSGWQGHPEKITTQMVGNTAPDVMQVNWDWLFTFSKNGNGYYDLNKLNSILELDKNYSADILASTTINGKLNAVPYGMTGKVFYYNKTAYEKAGLTVPKSFAEMKVAAKTMKSKLGNDFYAMDLDQYGAFLMILYILEQETGKGFIENNKVAYTAAELEKGFKFYTDLVAEGVVPSMTVRGAAGNVPLDQHPSWIKGLYGGTYEWDSAAKKWQDSLEAPQELVVGEFPKDFGTHNAAFHKVSMAFAINKDTKNPEAAAKLIKFLTTDEEGVKILKTSRGIPANKSADKVLRESGILKGLAYEGNQKVLAYTGKTLSPKFENKNLQSLYRDTIEQLGYKKITEKQAAEQIINKVNEFLANEK